VTNHWIDRGRQVLPHAGAVAWRLLVAVAVLEISYLVLANVVLKTSLLKDFAATSDDLRVDYSSAHSVLPGRIEVRDLRVRFHDRNVEFLISVAKGTLDVSLHELAVRRFHALRVDAEKVSYRMRHKVSRVGKEGPRLAAYPPIPGFRDPPLYEKGEDKPAPPIPDEKYDLWDVKVEGVHAEVAEVWILEYRYQGPGLATGSFRVKPTRYYDVTDATLDVHGGTLSLGPVIVAKQANLAIDCTVTGSDPRRLHGLEPLRHVSAGVRGKLEGTDLAFLDAYLGPHLEATARGPASLELDLRIERGLFTPGSRVELASSDARVEKGPLHVTGPVTIGLSRPSKVAEPSEPFEIMFRSPHLAIQPPKGAAASVKDIDLRGAFTPDLTQPVRLVRASLAPLRAEVADLGALRRSIPAGRDLPEISGRALLALQASKSGNEPIRGALALELTDATLTVGGARTLPWNATLASDDVVAEISDTQSVRGTVALRLDRASALLPLVTSSAFFQNLGERVLALGAVDAKARLTLAKHSRLELAHARSGIVQARGWVEEQNDGIHGRMLITTNAANVGVTISPNGTETHLLVGDDWLRGRERPRGGLRRPERGAMSRSASTPTRQTPPKPARALH
jgi:hypothetical protein